MTTTTPKSTSLALAPPTSAALAPTLPAHAFEPGDARQLWDLAETAVASGLMPRAIQRPEQAFVMMMAGRELGLTAMQSLRSIHVVEGKPTLSADLMVALCRRSPECAWIRLVESTPERAVYEALRRGDPGPTRMAFTIEEARTAGLATKDNWKRYPAAMLRARCAAALCRAVFPDLMLGIYDSDSEEIEPREPAPLRPPVTVEVLPPQAPPSEPRAEAAPNPTEDWATIAETLAWRAGDALSIEVLDAVQADAGKALPEGRAPQNARRKVANALRDARSRIAAAASTAPPPEGAGAEGEPQ